jgi:peptidyl-prolyl cis-trans isomerase B (cyclophilin B)
MNYTVYGEVVSGLEVVDKIAAAEKEPGDRPKKDIRMKMELMK